MYYSIISINNGIVTMEDPFCEVTITTSQMFDYTPEENDVVTLEGELFVFAKEETQRRKTENYERLQRLIARD
ncbi:MAG: hypothetical protein RR162_08890 [Oscillospiraceae bacterium]